MTRIKRTALLALSALAAVAAIAFAQEKGRMDAAAPTVGAAAPAYSLPDQDGKLHTLAGDQGKVILLAFYPKDFTGGCTLEAHSLTAAYPGLKAMGVTVYGVSVQDPKSHQGFCAKEGITYPLLADTEKKMATNYGVLIPGIGIANRATYILGADGKVAYVDKDVNSHLTTCGADWATWIKTHLSVQQDASSAGTPSAPAAQPASYLLSTSPLRVWRSLDMVAGANASGKGIAIGTGAYDFTLPNATTSAPTSVASLAQGKKATVVMFLSTRCPVSNAYNDRMVALAQKYGPQGVAFVGVDANTTEPTGEIAAFSKAKGFTFPVLKDAEDKVADAYYARVTPEAFVINSSGVLVYHGRIDNDMDPSGVKTQELADALDATLAGKPVAKAQTKAFGCSIKRG